MWRRVSANVRMALPKGTALTVAAPPALPGMRPSISLWGVAAPATRTEAQAAVAAIAPMLADRNMPLQLSPQQQQAASAAVTGGTATKPSAPPPPPLPGATVANPLMGDAVCLLRGAAIYFASKPRHCAVGAPDVLPLFEALGYLVETYRVPPPDILAARSRGSGPQPTAASKGQPTTVHSAAVLADDADAGRVTLSPYEVLLLVTPTLLYVSSQPAPAAPGSAPQAGKPPAKANDGWEGSTQWGQSSAPASSTSNTITQARQMVRALLQQVSNDELLDLLSQYSFAGCVREYSDAIGQTLERRPWTSLQAMQLLTIILNYHGFLRHNVDRMMERWTPQATIGKKQLADALQLMLRLHVRHLDCGHTRSQNLHLEHPCISERAMEHLSRKLIEANRHLAQEETWWRQIPEALALSLLWAEWHPDGSLSAQAQSNAAALMLSPVKAGGLQAAEDENAERAREGMIRRVFQGTPAGFTLISCRSLRTDAFLKAVRIVKPQMGCTVATMRACLGHPGLVLSKSSVRLRILTATTAAVDGLQDNAAQELQRTAHLFITKPHVARWLAYPAPPSRDSDALYALLLRVGNVAESSADARRFWPQLGLIACWAAILSDVVVAGGLQQDATSTAFWEPHLEVLRGAVAAALNSAVSVLQQLHAFQLAEATPQRQVAPPAPACDQAMHFVLVALDAHLRLGHTGALLAPEDLAALEGLLHRLFRGDEDASDTADPVPSGPPRRCTFALRTLLNAFTTPSFLTLPRHLCAGTRRIINSCLMPRPDDTASEWLIASQEPQLVTRLAAAWAQDNEEGTAFAQAIGRACLFGMPQSTVIGQAPTPIFTTVEKVARPLLLECCGNLFTALTANGEWPSSLITPLTQFIVRTCDVVPSADVFKGVFAAAHAHENEFKRHAVSSLVAKTLSVLVDADNVVQYHNDGTYIGLLSAALPLASAEHRPLLSKLSHNLTTLLSPHDLAAFFNDTKNDVHLEAVARRMFADFVRNATANNCAVSALIQFCQGVMVPQQLLWTEYPAALERGIAALGGTAMALEAAHIDATGLASALRKCAMDMRPLNDACSRAAVELAAMKISGMSVKRACSTIQHLVYIDSVPVQDLERLMLEVVNRHIKGGVAVQDMILGAFLTMHRVRCKPDAAAEKLQLSTEAWSSILADLPNEDRQSLSRVALKEVSDSCSGQVTPGVADIAVTIANAISPSLLSGFAAHNPGSVDQIANLLTVVSAAAAQERVPSFDALTAAVEHWMTAEQISTAYGLGGRWSTVDGADASHSATATTSSITDANRFLSKLGWALLKGADTAAAPQRRVHNLAKSMNPGYKRLLEARRIEPPTTGETAAAVTSAVL